jgi:amidophosphoribosyltransferase
MCGIIGVISKESRASFDAYNGLLELQHRGQDAAGIFALSKSGKISLKKENGLVHNIFNQTDLENLVGNIAIGQVRYPTTTEKKDAQPFYSGIGGVALAHNGHILNEGQLREKLREKDIYCDSDCDAETLLNVFSYFYLKEKGSSKEKSFNALKSVMKVVLGSYSVVSVTRNDGGGLLAFRDPHAIRPFVYGKKDSAYAFASESIALKQLGFQDIKNVEPGEAIFIDNHLNIESRIIDQKEPKHCYFEYVYFSRATSEVEKRSVNKVRANLGKELARSHKLSDLYKTLNGSDPKEVITSPVPETARPSGIVFAEEMGYTYKDCLEKRRYSGRNFIKPDQKLREKEANTVFVPIKEVIKGKVLHLIDDSIVRSTTSSALIKGVRECNPKAIHFYSTCPPLRYPCNYGIDFHKKGELIAYNKTPEEIAKVIGADSLTYMNLGGLLRSIGLPKKYLCLDCINGEHPTAQKISDSYLKKIFR